MSRVMSSSRTKVAPLVDTDGHVLCKHNQPAKRLISSTPANPGRAFYGCAKQRDDPGSCKFFAWEDSIPGLAVQTVGSSSQSSKGAPPSSQGSSQSTPTPQRVPHQSRLVPALPVTPTRPPPILADSAAISAAPAPTRNIQNSPVVSPSPAKKATPSWNNARERAQLKAMAQAEAEALEAARLRGSTGPSSRRTEKLFAESEAESDPEDEDLEEVFVDAKDVDGGDSDVEVISAPAGSRSSLSTRTTGIGSSAGKAPLNSKVIPNAQAGPSTPSRHVPHKAKQVAVIPSDSESEGGIDWEHVDVESVMASATSTPSTSQFLSDSTPSSAPRIGLGVPPHGSGTILSATSGGQGNLMDRLEAVDEIGSGGKRRRVSDAEGDQERHEKGARVEDEGGEWKRSKLDQTDPFLSPPPSSRPHNIMPDTPITPGKTQSPSSSMPDITELLSPIQRMLERQNQIIAGRDKQIEQLKKRLEAKDIENEDLRKEIMVERRRFLARDD